MSWFALRLLNTDSLARGWGGEVTGDNSLLLVFLRLTGTLLSLPSSLVSSLCKGGGCIRTHNQPAESPKRFTLS